MRAWRGWKRIGRWGSFLGFTAPALLLILFFIILPALQTIALSFTDRQGAFVGLRNFVQVLSDPDMPMSI